MDEAADDSPVELERLRSRDPAAFARLVTRHQKIVFGLGQSMGLRGPDLDDAAAEVFAAVFKSLPSFQAKSALGTWVYRIAIRTIGRVRSKRRDGAGEALNESQADVSQAPPDARAETLEMNERVWAAVAKLDPRQATAVELYYRREWPLEQIAGAMECPVGTIKTLLFRAREQLRAAFTRQEIGL